MAPGRGTDLPGVVLLHGFFHGAWCWTDVAARLSATGRRVLAVDMAGHGLRARRPASAGARPFDAGAFAAERSPVAHVDLDAAGALLHAQVEDFGAGRPVVVAAHSGGGPVLTRLAQTAPALVHHAVYVTAFMPASGVPAAAYIQAPEQEGDLFAPLFVGDPATTGALRLDTGGAAGPGLRRALYGDVPEELADAAIGLLTPDAPVGIAAGTTALTAEGWGAVPRTYVHCSQDAAIRPATQRRFVAEADAAFPDSPTTVVELDSSHSPFLSAPAALAEVLAALP